MRKSFDEAVKLFQDGTFDLIFVDGFARKGQCRGSTMVDWWPKLKIGGIMAIHDYTPKYPLNVKTIKKWAKKYGLKGHVTQKESKPSWITQKVE